MKTPLLTTTILIAALCHTSIAAPHRHAPKPIWRDPGVDVGIIQTPTALFANPDAASQKVGPLQTGAWTVLVSHQKPDGWLHVIGLSTGRIGWVRANRLEVRYTRHPNKGVDLPSAQTGTGNAPVIHVKNNSNRMLYLHMGALPEIRVSPHSAQSVTLAPGVCSFNASLPNVIPVFGDKVFVAGEQYDWTWWIKSHSDEHHAKNISASPALKAEIQDLQNAIVAETADLKVEQKLLDSEEATLKDQDAKLDNDQKEIATERADLGAKDQAEVDAFNAKVDAYNDELNTHKQAVQANIDHIRTFNARLNALNAKKNRLEKIAQRFNEE